MKKEQQMKEKIGALGILSVRNCPKSIGEGGEEGKSKWRGLEIAI